VMAGLKACATKLMNRISLTSAALLLLILIPTAALAELRRVDLQVLGMD
jgi:hypothetical protein